MPSSRKVKHCAYCGRKFEPEETKYHSEEQYQNYLKTVREGTHTPDTRKGIRAFGGDGTVTNTGDGRMQIGTTQHYYYSRPPYACKDCVNRSGGNPDLL